MPDRRGGVVEEPEDGGFMSEFRCDRENRRLETRRDSVLLETLTYEVLIAREAAGQAVTEATLADLSYSIRAFAEPSRERPSQGA